MSKLTLESRARLHCGTEIPWLGLGVWQVPSGRETVNTVAAALQAGYRHIDTAAAYKNEAGVGAALRASGLPREKIFVTTKVWNTDQGYDSTLRACRASLERLGMETVDLYLLHWPVRNLRNDSWRALEHLFQNGTCRAIGVSNFTVRHLKELLEQAKIVPAVNQVEFSPFLYQRELLEFCRDHQIQLEAYSPLAQGQKLQDPRLLALARNYQKTPAQMMLRWALQHEVVVIPKSVHPARILENSQIFDFEISGPDMNVLDGLNENFRVAWDPTHIP